VLWARVTEEREGLVFVAFAVGRRKEHLAIHARIEVLGVTTARGIQIAQGDGVADGAESKPLGRVR
jgi:hypothetical protein